MLECNHCGDPIELRGTAEDAESPIYCRKCWKKYYTEDENNDCKEDTEGI